jgi:hypothetical protein
MRTGYRRLAITIGIIGVIAALTPLATAWPASAGRFPVPYRSAWPGPSRTAVTVSGKIIFTGFPAGITLTGRLRTTWEQCVDNNNGHPFSITPDTTIVASVKPDADIFADCSEKSVRSVWSLSIYSQLFAGKVVFSLSQRAPGRPYVMVCRSATGSIRCQDQGRRRIVVTSTAPLSGLLPGARLG